VFDKLFGSSIKENLRKKTYQTFSEVFQTLMTNFDEANFLNFMGKLNFSTIGPPVHTREILYFAVFVAFEVNMKDYLTLKKQEIGLAMSSFVNDLARTIYRTSGANATQSESDFIIDIVSNTLKRMNRYKSLLTETVPGDINYTLLGEFVDDLFGQKVAVKCRNVLMNLVTMKTPHVLDIFKAAR
jgi:hypothetical protein